MEAFRLTTRSGVGESPRSVQVLEIAIDALETLEAGGTLTYDAEAPAFWVLADAEGNEACITTWQGREG